MVEGIEKISGQSMDIELSEKEKLKSVFPQCFNDGKLDIDKLLNLCGEYIDNDFEKYKFEWKGKSNCYKIAGKRSTGTLRPCKDESVNFDTTKNLYIEGDNLEVLKLLQNAYFRKVKMIYIDPPYNTGNDFVYEDDFADPMAKYKEITQQTTKSNPETMGRFHTNWLNMMYPRLRLASNLLRDDGVIFISIDDNEVTNLKKLCDEVFGEENFINIISVNMKNVAGASGGGEDKRLKKNIEYLLMYAKNYDTLQQFAGPYNYTEISDLIASYKEEGISWKYNSVLVCDGEKEYLGSITDGSGDEIKVYKRTNCEMKSIKQIATENNITEKEVYKNYATKIFRTTNAQSSIRTRVVEFREKNNIQDEILSIEYIPKSGKNKGNVYEQFYKGDNLFVWLKDTSELIDNKLYKKDLIGTYWDFVGETKNLTKEGDVVFPNGKKPLKMLKRLVEMQTNEDDIILDFFSGSATTAHAVMQVNAEDGGNRRFIMVQLPALCEDNSEPYKAGFKTICEIGEERIRRAGKKLTENSTNQLSLEEKQPLDIGFRVFKLDTSNLAKWDSTPTEDEEELQTRFLGMADTVKVGRTPEDLVYEVMLKLGIPLDYKVIPIKINDKEAFAIGEDCLVLVCTDKGESGISGDDIRLMCDEYTPAKIVTSEEAFADDSALSNAYYILKDKDIEMEIL